MQYFILLMAWTPKPVYLGLNLPFSVTSSVAQGPELSLPEFLHLKMREIIISASLGCSVQSLSGVQLFATPWSTAC